MLRLTLETIRTPVQALAFNHAAYVLALFCLERALERLDCVFELLFEAGVEGFLLVEFFAHGLAERVHVFDQALLELADGGDGHIVKDALGAGED